MGKKIWFLLSTFVLVFNFNLIAQAEQKNENSKCLKKLSSSWASKCEQCLSDANSYRVNLKNICESHIDVRVAVQEKALKWKVFNVNNMAPGDTLSGYACEGTGKYVYWTRTAGDASIVFPTESEIEAQYNK